MDLNYGIIVDVSSTGSRLFPYCWPAHTGSEFDLIAIRPVLDKVNVPVIKKVSPGLSTVASPETDRCFIPDSLQSAIGTGTSLQDWAGHPSKTPEKDEIP